MNKNLKKSFSLFNEQVMLDYRNLNDDYLDSTELFDDKIVNLYALNPYW
jgi:hypothetical protein